MEEPKIVGCLVSCSTDVKRATKTQNCSTKFSFFGVKLMLSVARVSNLVTITLRGVGRDSVSVTGKMRLLVDRLERYVSADGSVACRANSQLRPHDRQDFEQKSEFVWQTTLDPDVCGMTIDIEFCQIALDTTIPVKFDVLSEPAVFDNPGLFLNLTRIEGSQHVMDVMHKLHLSDEGKDCSVVLLHGNDGRVEGSPIKAHSIILGASSREFANNLQDVGVNKEFTLELIDADRVTLPVVNALVTFLYGVLGGEELFKHRDGLLFLSQKYAISHLRDACHKSMSIDISSSNVVERLKYADCYDLDELVDNCLEFISRKLYDIQDMNTLVNDTTEHLRNRLRNLFHKEREIALLFGWTQDAADK